MKIPNVSLFIDMLLFCIYIYVTPKYIHFENRKLR